MELLINRYKVSVKQDEKLLDYLLYAPINNTILPSKFVRKADLMLCVLTTI